MHTTCVILAAGSLSGTRHPLLESVAGYPLLARSLRTARESLGKDASIVCCDDPALARLAARYGARVAPTPSRSSSLEALALSLPPHPSPAEVVALLGQVSQTFGHPGSAEAWVLLDPYHPFTTPEDICSALNALDAGALDVVTSSAEHPPQARASSPTELRASGNFHVVRGSVLSDGAVTADRVSYQRIREETAFCVRGPHDLPVAHWLAARLGARRPMLPNPIDAVVFDFDGVFTGNTVYVDQAGVETIRASRGDGMGIGRLKAAGIPCSVLSKEPNPVVLRRCEKLKIPCTHGVDDKLPTLIAWASQQGYLLSNLVYVGNDINDLECLEAVGFGIAVADAVPDVLAAADYVLGQPGGQGAVREVCDWILDTQKLSGS